MRTTILAAGLLAMAATGAFAQDTVRIGTEGAYPPYNYIGDDGKLAGFEIDLGTEMCKRAALTCEFVQNDWDSIIPNLVSGNYDVIMAGMSITPERDEVIDFTQDYYPPTPSAYVGLTPEADTKGKVAAQTATIQAAYVADSGAALLEFSTPEETVAAVRNGEADAVFADYDFLKPIVDSSSGELAFIGDRVAIGGGVGAGVRESDTELKGKLDAVLTEMKGDGSLNALLAKWFPNEADPSAVPAYPAP